MYEKIAKKNFMVWVCVRDACIKTPGSRRKVKPDLPTPGGLSAAIRLFDFPFYGVGFVVLNHFKPSVCPVSVFCFTVHYLFTSAAQSNLYLLIMCLYVPVWMN